MYRKIIKVFLGSPGDLEQERKAAKLIVDEENTNHANELGYHIDLVGWEDTVSQRRRAQDAINIDLDQCEYFVGLMWKKWGTPPGPEGHPYTSGFEEEYRRSVDRHERTTKPEISLLFKEIPKDDLLDVGRQLEKVLAFQKEISEEKKQYYQKFQDLRDFERRFRAIIAKFLKDQQLEDKNAETHDPQKSKNREEESKDQDTVGKQSKIFDSGALQFIERFVKRDQDGGNTFSAAEAARFRLLACSVSQSGNDSIALGTHDANLIYRDLRHSKLSRREHIGLLSAALESLDSTTVPLWHWIFLTDFRIRRELPLRTIWGGEKQRRNAFKLLEKLAITPGDFEGSIEKSEFVRFWLGEHVSNDLIISAIDYLGSIGDRSLDVDWPAYIDNSEANIARAAIRANVRIKSRTNTTEALRFVAEHEGADLGHELTHELLSNISTIETSVLRDCLNNRTKNFLIAIVAELFNRDALTKDDAHLLCDSADADVRLFGVKALAKHSSELTLTDARKLLVKPPKSNVLGLSSSSQDRDYLGEGVFEDYRIGFLADSPYNHLINLQKEESFYSTEYTLALYQGHFKRVKAEFEENLLDGFETFCTVRRAAIEGSPGEPSESVYGFIKANLIQSAFEVFCAAAMKSDLATVREVMDKFEVKYSKKIVEFLAKHGQWEDAVRVAKLSGKPKYRLGLSMLSVVDRSKDYKLSANTILKLGAKRIADAWKLDLSTPVRVKLVDQMPNKLFAAFDDQKIIEMLLWDSDVVREAVALKAVLCLPKARLCKILEAYYEVDGSYYYNVIFWLDLGVSADRETSRAIALRELSVK